MINTVNNPQLRNKMAKGDSFKHETTLEITKKGNRGTVAGFWFTIAYAVLMNVYIWS